MEATHIKKLNKLKVLSHLFFFSIIFLTPLPNLGTDIYTPSLPTLVSALDTNTSLVKFSVTIYLITYGVGQLIFGVLSDIVGRRHLLLLGIISFTILSIVGSFTTSIIVLILSRFFQGLSVSIVSVITKSIITDKYRGQKLKKASNYKVAAQVLSLIFAPLLGSYLQSTLSWRWIFILLAFYGTLCWYFTISFIPETCKIKTPYHPKSIYLNLRQVFMHQKFILMTLNTSICYAIIGFYGIIGPFIIQKTLHYSTLVYGLTALCCGVAYLLGSIFSDKISIKISFIACLSLFIVSPLILIFIGLIGLFSLIAIIFPIMLLMMGCGLLLPKIMIFTLGLFRTQAGTANAVFGALVMIGMGSILSLAGLIHTENTISLGILYLTLGVSCTLLLAYKGLYKDLC